MAEIITQSEADTRALAAKVAGDARTGDCFALRGDLGAGKSVFARGFIQALIGDAEVPSPTFTLVQLYETPAGPLYHFDLYRLDGPDDVWELGWEEALAAGICLVEWPDKAGPYLPKTARVINFTTLADESRKIGIDDPRS